MSTLELGQKALDLPRDEKLDLIEKLQESLDESDHQSPVWHEDVLNERLAKIERGEAKFISIEEIRTRYGLPNQ